MFQGRAVMEAKVAGAGMAWPSAEPGKARVNWNSAVKILNFHYIYHLQSIQFSPFL